MSSDCCPALNGRRGLDACMLHLCPDHIERNLACDPPGAKGMAQPVGGSPGGLFPLCGRQAGRSHGAGYPALDMLVQRLVAKWRHRMPGAGQ